MDFDINNHVFRMRMGDYIVSAIPSEGQALFDYFCQVYKVKDSVLTDCKYDGHLLYLKALHNGTRVFTAAFVCSTVKTVQDNAIERAYYPKRIKKRKDKQYSDD